MLTEHLDAATAAIRVGYENPSQFSSEYRRLFGEPPLRDLRNLHQTLQEELGRRKDGLEQVMSIYGWCVLFIDVYEKFVTPLLCGY
jgi:AraC-like DNA-binding protein